MHKQIALGTPFAAFVLCALAQGCTSKADGPVTVVENVDSTEDPLLVAANTWPTKAISACFRPTQAENGEMDPCSGEAEGAQWSSRTAERQAVQTAFNNTWGTISKVRLLGWGVCTQTQQCNPNWVTITLLNGACKGRSQVGYIGSQSKGAWLTMWTELCSAAMITPITAHEVGHILAFQHEHARDDAPANLQNCAPSDEFRRGTGTKVGAFDMSSIMESGYCDMPLGTFTATDILGVRMFYGPKGEDTVLAMQPNTKIYEKHYRNGAWSTWSEVPGLTDARYGQAITFTSDAQKVAFVVKSDGSVQTNANRNGSWIGWFPLGGFTHAAPAAISVESSSDAGCAAGQNSCGTKLYLTVFILDDVTDKYKFKYYDPAIGAWTSWANVGNASDTFASAPAVTISRTRRTQVFGRKSDGKIYTSFSNTGLTNWSAWSLVPGFANASFIGDPAAVTSAEGQDTVVAMKSDGKLYYNYYDPAQGVWSGFINSLDGSVCWSSPTVAVSPGGRLTVYCQANGWLITRYRDNGVWSSWITLDGTPISTVGAMQ